MQTTETVNHSDKARARAAVVKATLKLSHMQRRIARFYNPDATTVFLTPPDTPTLHSMKVELERLLPLTVAARTEIDGQKEGTMADITRLCQQLEITL